VIEPDVQVEGVALIAALADAGAAARLLGGVAIAQHRHEGWSASFDRVYGDIDFVTGSRSRRAVESVMADRGYEAAQPFNRLHGDRRLLFLDHAHARQVDVFLGQFSMCHTLELDGRLAGHPTTLVPADLLLTKLQVAEPDPKDLRDAVALLHQHVLGSDADGDVLGVDRLVEVTSADWGWWTTFTDNLERVPGAAALLLDDAGVVEERCAAIASALQAAPKGLRWRARAKVGRRVPWREQPEEHEAGIHG
jgi:hypothetical protein